MNNLNQIERIKVKLRLARNTDILFETFGASSHRYVLGEPLTNQQITEFEDKYNVQLPSGYRQFLTEVGNGGIEYENSVVGNSGAGPNYGIFKLGHKYHQHNLGPDCTNYQFDQEPLLTTQTTEQIWEQEISDRGLDNEDDDDPELYDIAVSDMYRGTMAVSFGGCSIFTGIILNGADSGRVICMYDEIEYCPNFIEESSFLDWYEAWLGQVISGQSFVAVRYVNGEEQLLKDYLKATEEHWVLVALRKIRSLDTASTEMIELLTEKYNQETNPKVKDYLCSILIKLDYLNNQELLQELLDTRPLEFLRNLHLYAKDNISEWSQEVTKLSDTCQDNNICEYIEYLINPHIMKK